MRFVLENKPKLEAFVALFQLLKNWSSRISMVFQTERLYIQCMDSSHICLAEIDIKDNWFTEYECPSENNNISVDVVEFATLLNYALKHEKLEVKFEEEQNPDKIYINFLNNVENKGTFDHFFELNLIDSDDDNLSIPQVEYDVDFTIDAKQMVELFTELNTFGTDLHITCTEKVFELNTSGDSTKLKIHITIDDLDEYAIGEGDEVQVSYSLGHLRKMCLSMKLSSKINISISNELPMRLLYDLGNDSKVSLYIAPKIVDDDA